MVDAVPGGDRTLLPALHDYFHFYFTRRYSMQVGANGRATARRRNRHRIVHVPGR